MITDLSAREEELMDQAYARGLATGYQQGAEETFRHMTQLTTMLNDRRTEDALEQLLRVIQAMRP